MSCITQRTAIDPTDRSYFDTGFFCTLLGVQHPTCRFFDRLYGALVIVFEKVFGTAPGAAVDAKGLAKSLFKYFVQAAQEDSQGVFLTHADICSVAPSDQPDEITWLDLFLFLQGESDAFFEKMTQWWLYQTAYSVCQCAPIPTSIITPPSQGIPQLPPPINAPLNCQVIEMPPRELLIQHLEANWAGLLERRAVAQNDIDRFLSENFVITQSLPGWIVKPFSFYGYDWCVADLGDPSQPGIAFCRIYGEVIRLVRQDTLGQPIEVSYSVFMPSEMDYLVVFQRLLLCSFPTLQPYPPLPADPPDPFCQLFPEFCLGDCSTYTYTVALRTGCGPSPQPQVYNLPESSCPTNSYTLSIRSGCHAAQPQVYNLPDGNQI